MIFVEINWDRLKEIPQWTPLSDLSWPCTNLGDRLYRLVEHKYLVAVSYNWSLRTENGGPFATLLMWAPDDGAAKRVVSMAIEADACVSHLAVPSEMLLPGGALTYAEILAELKTGRHGTYLEYASYRLAVDGAFVQRVIECDPLLFCFRNLDDDDSARPYAVQYRLR